MQLLARIVDYAGMRTDFSFVCLTKQQRSATPESIFAVRLVYDEVTQLYFLLLERFHMQTNGLVFCAAISLSLYFTSTCLAFDQDTSSIVHQSLATKSPEDSVIEPVYFHCQQCSNSFWYVGADVLFLDINADSGGQITMSFNDTDTVGTDISIVDGHGLDDFGYAPRLTLGRQLSDKWAVAGRYFTLAAADSGFPELAPGTTPQPNFATFLSKNESRHYTIDLEAVRSFFRGKTKIDTSIGARHASLDVDSEVFAFGVFTTGNFVNLNLSNGSAFDGTGIVGGITFRRQIGDGPISIFFGGRSSKMWGRSDSFGRAVGSIAVSPNVPLIGAATVTRNNAESNLIINEFQLGLQFEFALRRIPATAYFRTALEYQDWDLNGPPTGGAGFGGTLGDLSTGSFASAGLGDTELVGLALASGFSW